MRNEFKKTAYHRVLSLMAAACAVSLIIISVLSFIIVKNHTIEYFLRDADAHFSTVKEFCRDLSAESYYEIWDRSVHANLGLTLRQADGTLISYAIPETKNIKYYDSVERALKNSADIRVFTETTEAYDFNGFYFVVQEKTNNLFEYMFSCARPLEITVEGTSIPSWAVFSREISLWTEYSVKFILLILLCIGVYLITGLCIARNNYNLTIEKIREVQSKHIMSNALTHDLKTPIAVISSCSEMIKTGRQPEKHNIYAEKILKNAEYLNSSVCEILKISDLEDLKKSIKREPLDLIQLTAEILQSFSEISGEIKTEIINKSVSSDAVTVHADRESLKSAIENLLSNAFKNAMPVSGESKIIITVRKRKWAVFNTGLHISDSSIDKVCEAYYVEDKSRSTGTGLGLYIAKSIFEAHGFKFGIENVENGVSSFFYFK